MDIKKLVCVTAKYANYAIKSLNIHQKWIDCYSIPTIPMIPIDSIHFNAIIDQNGVARKWPPFINFILRPFSGVLGDPMVPFGEGTSLTQQSSRLWQHFLDQLDGKVLSHAGK